MTQENQEPHGYIANTPKIETIYAQYEAIRKSGMTNMFDSNTVHDIAFGLNFFELAEEIENGNYGKILSNYENALQLGYITQ